MRTLKIFLLLTTILLISGCASEKEEEAGQKKLSENQIYVYLVNPAMTDVVPQIYTLDKDKDLAGRVTAVVRYLSKVEPTEEAMSPIVGGISYTGNSFEERNGRLTVSFNILYDAVDADTLLFFKCCVVRSLLQLEAVNSVALSMTDIANPGEDKATTVENFDQDSFAMSFGEENGYKQTGSIVLYFSNASGEALKEYRKTIEISSNTSLAKIVVESLIEGPQEDGYIATLSDQTTIRNISVKDGICYVDLSDEFYQTDNPLKNDMIVYSVVNSLVELPTVTKVQFLKNGEKMEFFRETMPFDGIFERNLDLIEQEETEE